MSKRKFFNIALISAFSFFFGLFSLGMKTVHAADGASFVLIPNMPENQRESTPNGYFNVNVKPGDSQTFTMQLKNTNSKTKQIRVSANTAYTNDSGTMANNLANPPKDPTLKYQFRDLTSPKSQTITLKGNETKTLTFTTKVPSGSFPGIIAGGFYALQLNNGTKSKNKNVTFINKYAYSVSALMREDTDTIEAPDLKLHNIYPGIKNGRIEIFARLQNPKPTILSQMSTDVKITKKGSTKVLRHQTANLQTMAPNSNYALATDWGKKAIEAGDYHMSFHGKTTGQSWHFERDFTISNSKANELNRQVGIKPNYLWLWILLGVLAVVLIILITYLLARRGRNNEAKK